jgi:hypothetical protein
VDCRSHKDCPSGKNATLCTIDRSRKTHSWPGAESDDDSEVGTKDINGDDQIWRFFAESTEQSDGDLDQDLPACCGSSSGEMPSTHLLPRMSPVARGYVPFLSVVLFLM